MTAIAVRDLRRSAGKVAELLRKRAPKR